MENKPDEFSKFGAIITIWAIFNISCLRNSYSSSITIWDISIFYKYIDFYKEKDKIQEERLDTTFNLHACQIAKIYAHLDVPNPFVENNKEAIKKFCRDVQSKIKKNSSQGIMLLSDGSINLLTNTETAPRQFGAGNLCSGTSK
jgi:hypothetical protein